MKEKEENMINHLAVIEERDAKVKEDI